MSSIKRPGDSDVGNHKKWKHDPARETNPITLVRRQRNIDYGKATEGYKNYVNAVPKETRTEMQPKTPDKYQVCSRRSWDGQIRIWRLLLHSYDNKKPENNNNIAESVQNTETEHPKSNQKGVDNNMNLLKPIQDEMNN